MRLKKAFNNTIFGFAYEITAIFCSFILPRLILTSFGSDYNGVTSAITQFLNVIALFQAGIGGVTMAALYKPLAEKDTFQISVIVKTTEKFLKKISLIFLSFTAVMSIVYPFFVKDKFDWFFTASLVMIMSISTFAQYFFGQTYTFLLNADQRQSFISVVNIVKIIANTAVAAILIKLGLGIREVKLGSAVVFAIAPIFIFYYTKKRYKIINDVKPDNSKLKQRWDNFGQQVANFVCVNTDLVVLTAFSNIYEISVYSIYNLVANGIWGIFNPLVKGMEAAFGNMFAKNEKNLILKNLRILEQVTFAASTFLFGVAAVLIVPFVLIFTKGVTDISYDRQLFAYVLVAATLFKCFRVPYMSIVNAVGHFRQTRNAAFIEAAINIILSIALVFKWGIIGVMIGNLAAYLFRSVIYALYISKNIVERSIIIFVKRLVLSLSNIVVIILLSNVLPFVKMNGYFGWIINAVMISVLSLLLIFATEFIFYRNDLKNLTKIFKNNLKRRKPIS